MLLMVNFKEREERVDLVVLIILMKKEFYFLKIIVKIEERGGAGVSKE